ncbi:MAG: NAD-dependent epimerase/dehydratase family protein [Candidatus Promineifilaceae bacterium]
MAEKTVVLVTGAAGYWGGRVAQRLSAESDYHVIGLDMEQPEEVSDIDFIQADIRNPLMAELMESEGVSIICHLQFREKVAHSETAFDLNVMGTMKLFGAAAQAGVEKIIVRSSTALYGALPDNSALLTEETPLRGSRKYGYNRDWLELEAFCNGFRGQHPEVALTTLRFANIVGPTADTPMTRFLKLQPPVVLLGFDPMLQFIHEDDAVEALAHAVLNDTSGTYNVAAEGPMPLTRVLTLTRKLPLPILHPLAYLGLDLLKGSPLRPSRFVPIEWDYLRYPWVADIAKMREEMGFIPQYMTDELLREFAGPRHIGQNGDGLADDETRLQDIIERRRRAREQTADEE